MKLLPVLTFVAVLSAVTPAAAQTLPPISASTTLPAPAPLPATEPAARIMSVVEAVVEELQQAGTQTKTAQRQWVVPLWRASREQIEHYYQSGRVSAGGHVDFLYGFGAATKTLRTELLAALFPKGLRLSLDATVTAGDSAEPGSPQEAESAIDRLRSGGDFALRAVMPLASVSGKQGQAYLMAAPALTFMVSGIAGAQTITESNEWSMDLAAESYGELKALDAGAALFGFVKAGRQTMSPAFANRVGAERTANWAMQGAVGVQLGGTIRVSLQRFSRPRTKSPVDENVTAAQWRLTVQLGARSQ